MALIAAGALGGLALANASPRAPTSAPFPFPPITAERTVVGSIVGPYTPAARAHEPAIVDFPAPATGYLGLRGGQLLATGDSGRNWRPVSDRLRFDALEFVSPRVGFGLSGRLLFRTVDGGRRWERLHAFPRDRSGFHSAGAVLSFVDRGHGWALTADGRLYRTSDGGRRWARLDFACGEEGATGISFVTRRVGFAVCGGQPATIMQERSYYRTDDGGETWQLTERRIFSGHVRGLEYVSEGVGFERAERGGIGRLPGHASVLDTGDIESVLSMSWPDGTHGYAILSHAGLVQTDDRGRHWRRVYPQSLPPPVGPLAFSSPRRGIGALLSLGIFTRPGAILATEDGGAGWRLRSSLGRSEIEALERVSPSVVWAISSDLQGRTVLFRSGTDGRHWRKIRSFAGAGPAWLSFPSKRDGFLGDDRGHLYRTNNAGRTWRALRYPGGISRGAFLSPSEGLAITDAELLATADGGLTWKHVLVQGLSIAFRTLDALDRRHVWVGGLDVTAGCTDRPCRGLLLRTADGGRHWTLIRLPHMIGFAGIEWLTPLVGYATDGGPHRTRDGGRSWRYVLPRNVRKTSGSVNDSGPTGGGS